MEKDTRPNKAGRAINVALIQEHNVCLITPKDLGTRVDPSSGKCSTINLTFTSPGLPGTPTTKLGLSSEATTFLLAGLELEPAEKSKPT
jgi:hypothetical protein